MTRQIETSFGEVPENGVAHSRASRQTDQRDQCAVVTVPITSLLPSDSPRLSGENMEHARALAESETAFPPIVVHRASMRIIDGMHRVRASTFCGQDEIEVQFFDGDTEEAFILSVKANISHGLPLSLADRKAAAARIISSHPQWSDRAIAPMVGLAPKTVGTIRKCSTEEKSQLNTRIGRDGRVRPLGTTEGRRIASELITDRPDASLREIASAAGISLGTAQNVRKRLCHAENALVTKQYDKNQRKDQLKRHEPASLRDSQISRRSSIRDRVSILNSLRKDPSLRFAEPGRILLRILHILALGTREWERLINNVPPHCTPSVSNAARACADAWLDFAEQLERR